MSELMYFFKISKYSSESDEKMILSKDLVNKNELIAQTINGFPFRWAMFLLGNLLEPDLAGTKAIFLKASLDI